MVEKALQEENIDTIKKLKGGIKQNWTIGKEMF